MSDGTLQPLLKNVDDGGYDGGYDGGEEGGRKEEGGGRRMEEGRMEEGRRIPPGGPTTFFPRVPTNGETFFKNKSRFPVCYISTRGLTMLVRSQIEI